MTADIKRQFRKMTGDAMREIGVLLFVFAPLDSFFARDRLTLIGIVVIVVFALCFLLVGMMLGLDRQ